MGCRIAGLWLVAGLLSGLSSGVVQAGQDEGCIDVQVGQARALAYDCLTRQLQNGNGQRAAQANRKAMEVDVSRRAPNQLGLFNQSATRQRMGNAFGVSVRPQRPGP
ncbi:hypothetical protein N0B28_15695 [Pseudomonas sp. SD17-1]|uniref:hypothetical protein n=1 Tax=Pseudomonas sp. SD17-1 TaxID=2976883 RepID=UPI0023DA2922|nr:hypothetical protein [Pseudomonas sp. SD17-1]WEJ19739.1 hypothetical protein N0B28_15695 [Pseudomonas sp. SD17-1]